MKREREARRALDRLAFGPSPGAVERVAAQGPEAWIRAELERGAPPTQVPEPPPADLIRRPPREREERRSMREALRHIGAGVVTERIERALSGEHPLFETLVDFWGNHFAVNAKKGPLAALLPSFEHEVLRAHALGRFPELLLATARHPAMLLYLDNWRSAAPAEAAGERRPRRRFRRVGRRPEGLNENYARELLELHTLGDPHAFEQRDVEEVARAFTGWTLTRAGGRPAFRFEPSWHDDGPKRVLGESLPAGGGRRDGERVIALLARHPVTARSVARKLAVRLIADEPPAAAVARAAAAFSRSGGDIATTVAALLLDGPELFSAAAVKVKTPFEWLVSSLRGTGARVADPRGVIGGLKRLGHLPYLALSPAGHPDVAAAWIDPGAMLERTRFAFALAGDWLPGVRIPDAERLDAATLPRSPLGPATRAALATSGLASRERIALALASPEFQLR